MVRNEAFCGNGLSVQRIINTPRSMSSPLPTPHYAYIYAFIRLQRPVEGTGRALQNKQVLWH